MRRVYSLTTVAFSLGLLAGCVDEKSPVEPDGRGFGPLPGPSFAITPVSEPVNLTQHAALQQWPQVSGRFAVWTDGRDSPPPEIWGCEIGEDLTGCAGSAVRIATNVGFGEGRVALAGSRVIWTDLSTGALRACDLGPTLEEHECVGEDNSVALANVGGLVDTSGRYVVWTQVESPGVVGLYGCDIGGGLEECLGTTMKLSREDNPPRASPPAIDGTIVAWTGPSFDIIACDIANGLGACAENGDVAADTEEQEGEGGLILPAVSGTRIFWLRNSVDPRIEGCDVSEGATSCEPITIRDAPDQPEGPFAIDGNVLVWREGSGEEPGMHACDLGEGLSECAEPVRLGDPGTFPAISGATVVWQQAVPDLLSEIMGVRLDGVEPPENHPPLAFAGADQTSMTGPTPRSITLDGSSSFDPDPEDVLTYRWTEGDVFLGQGEIIEVLLALGEHIITLTVSDGQLEDADETFVTVLNGTRSEDGACEQVGDLLAIAQIWIRNRLGVTTRCALLAALRQEKYFGIAENRVSASELLELIDASPKTFVYLIDQVDYGRHLEDFLSRRTDKLRYTRYVNDDLPYSAEVIAFLTRISTEFGNAFGSAPLQIIGASLNVLTFLGDFEAAWDGAMNVADVVVSGEGTICPVRDMLESYFDKRKGSTFQNRLQAWENFVDEWRRDGFGQCFDGLARVLKRPQEEPLSMDRLSDWFESAFVAYRWVHYSDSGEIRREVGRGLGDIARESFRGS